MLHEMLHTSHDFNDCHDGHLTNKAIQLQLLFTVNYLSYLMIAITKEVKLLKTREQILIAMDILVSELAGRQTFQSGFTHHGNHGGQ